MKTIDGHFTKAVLGWAINWVRKHGKKSLDGANYLYSDHEFQVELQRRNDCERLAIGYKTLTLVFSLKGGEIARIDCATELGVIESGVDDKFVNGCLMKYWKRYMKCLER